MHAPTAIVPSLQPAQAVIAAAHGSMKNVLACWSGGDAVRDARKAFAAAGLPSFATPDAAARAFVHMVDYRSEEHTSELQSIMHTSYAVLCLKKKTRKTTN